MQACEAVHFFNRIYFIDISKFRVYIEFQDFSGFSAAAG
jgi:hypothetical protein